MIQSKLKPVTICLRKMRLRYNLQGMRMGAYYSVIAYDMKRLLVTNNKADTVYYVAWKDVELYRSEFIANQSVPSLGVGDIQALRRTLKQVASAIPSSKNQ